MRALSLLILVGAAGCATIYDPGAKAAIDSRVARLPAPAQTFPVPTAPAPLPLAVGQWTQHQMIDDAGRPSFLTMKLVGEASGSYWLEILEETYSGRRVTKMLVYFGDRASATSMDIRFIKTRLGTGPVTDTPVADIPGARDTWQGVLALLGTSWQGLPQETARVPAGIFTACYRRDSEDKWGPLQTKSTVWAHPAVPLSGLVRSQAVDGPHSLQLVAFGERGAVSEME
jgi:hypothetical protein